MVKNLLRLTLILILVSIACNLPTRVVTPEPAPKAVVAQLFITAGPDATATPTPFQPVGPTATPLPTATPTLTPTITPTATPTKLHMDPNTNLDVMNLMVLGSDYRPNSGFRTDVIMLISIHPKTATVRVVSFPRDLYVTIPGWGDERINTAFPRGGFSGLADTLEYNFGVRPRYYVMTNFDGFIRLVNSMGGVNVNVAKELHDKCDLPQQRAGYCTVGPGVVNMDGNMALWYIRSRYSSSDFDRLRRAQEVLSGMFRQLMTLNILTRVPELYAVYTKTVETNLSVGDIVPLLPVASEVFDDPGRITRYVIGPSEAYPYTAPSGAMVLLPNYYAIMDIVKKAVSP